MSVKNPKFTQIKTAMLLHFPFFASLLLDVMDVEIGKFDHIFPPGMTPTAATNGKTIYFDEDWLSALAIEEAVFVTCHEIAHAMWMHFDRAKRYLDLGFDGEQFSPVLWNIAGDYIINDMIKKCGIGRMPAGGLWDAKYTEDMICEEAYRDLLKEQKKKGGGKGQGQGQGGKADGSGGHGGFDIHMPALSPISPAEMKRAVQSAADAAKAVGCLPGNLERFASAIVDPKVHWKDVLRATLVKTILHETKTWTQPHRRRLTSQRLYLPRHAGFACDTIVVAIDTSGSIGPKELDQFLSELADILRTCKPRLVHVLGADAAVATHVELEGDADIAASPPKVGGGGGTDFRPAFEWVREHDVIPDAFVYLTDMCGPFPSDDPGYPVIWGRTTTQDAPFGIHVDIDFKS